MGCDIHCYAEKLQDGQWVYLRGITSFHVRHYGIFAFLAGVRNYSAITPISPTRWLPEDVSDAVNEEHEIGASDAHSASWLSVAELLAVDYDQQVEDRRCTRGGDGGCTCEPGQGELMTLREFLGPCFFASLKQLQDAGADRIVFWFDG